MPSLWFVVPAHGRAELGRVCLRQLRRTCDLLSAEGIEATAVVIGDDENLDTALELGFGTVRRNNDFLGRKFNDGFQLACDPAFNPRPADYAMPYGTDDWVDHRILLNLPKPDTILAFCTLCLVREDGKEMTARHLNNQGGAGLRVYPRELIAAANYRPADEDRSRGCDSSTIANLKKFTAFQITYRYIDPRQIVDWKSSTQINRYDSVAWRPYGERWEDPFTALGDFYSPTALNEIRELY